MGKKKKTTKKRTYHEGTNAYNAEIVLTPSELKKGIERRNKAEKKLERGKERLESKSWEKNKPGFARIGNSKVQLTQAEMNRGYARAKKMKEKKKK